MKTIGDLFTFAWEKFIAPTKPPTTKETKIISFDNYSQGVSKSGYTKLTPARRREIANESPLLMKGIRKIPLRFAD